MNNLGKHLQILYPDCYEQVMVSVEELIRKWKGQIAMSYPWVDEKDIIMITYGDGIQKSGEAPLVVLNDFLNEELRECISGVHLLPMFPYTSDDGFSVSDFRAINEELGNWDDVARLGQNYDLMFDAVINHASKESRYFKGFLCDEEDYRDFFIQADPLADYSMVIRPRTLPLLTKFHMSSKELYVWTTFSDDQIDFNFKNEKVLLEILDILLFYASRGARFIRFDAVGFVWKEAGTTCMHLKQTHELVKLIRLVLEQCAECCIIITETNVPHKENIAYFGNGFDEAGLVYQFPLPPLTLYSFISGSACELGKWAASLEPTSGKTTYFNFLASHDGIGLRPVEDILTEAQRMQMIEAVKDRGGLVSMRMMPDKSELPYELNINYLSAIAGNEKDIGVKVQKYMASQCVLLSIMGMPGIYYHSLLGSENSYKDYQLSGINRRINREKLDYEQLTSDIKKEGSLRGLVLNKYKEMIRIRKSQKAFAPNSTQRVLMLDKGIFSLIRGEGMEQILVLINVSGVVIVLDTQFKGVDVLSDKYVAERITVEPYGYMWIKLEKDCG